MFKTKRIAFAAIVAHWATPPALSFETDATHAIIMDHETGIVLYSKNGDEPMTPASMTKMMTVYMVFERLEDGRLNLDDEVLVSENAWRKGGAASGGSTMFLEPGSRVRIEDLLKGVMIVSGNDACIALAEHISGSEEAFAAEMTERAQELGLDTLNFKNATGLYEDGHEVSAHDLAKLASMTISNYPEYYAYYAIPEFKWYTIERAQRNRNPLLNSFEGADGLKTGHLDASGYSLTSSAIIDGERRIVVINGAETKSERARISERLMRAAFREFTVSKPVPAGTVIGQAPVWLGTSRTVGVALKEDLVFGYEIAERKNIITEIVLTEALTAPVKAGDVLGNLKISGPDGAILTREIIAADSVLKVGLVEQAFTGLGVLMTPPKTDPDSSASAGQ